MANLLDEKTGPVNSAGQSINVIDKQLPTETGFGSVLFEIVLWFMGLLPGIIFLFMKQKAHNYFQQLEQKIQSAASEIDNYIEQRVVILQTLENLVNRAIDLDKDVMKSVAALRSGTGTDRNTLTKQVDSAYGRLLMHMEAYPELRLHNEIADAIQQNSYLQKEITAARTIYNSYVYQWNRDIFDWPTKQIVAAQQGYTTRIPYSASSEVKEMGRKSYFN